MCGGPPSPSAPAPAGRCAVLPLLLLLARSASPAPLAPAPGPAPLTPALLVLRAACLHPSPLQYFTRSLEDYSAMTHLHIDRLLSYNETCGSGWMQTATARLLVSAREVVVAGALGPARCALLAGAGVPVRGGGCTWGAAWARALAQLSTALGWRRALLVSPPTPAHAAGECGDAVDEAARALLVRGLAVASIELTAEAPPLQPQVVMVALCGPREAVPAVALRALAGGRGEGRGGAILLLLMFYDKLSAELSSEHGNSSNNNLSLNSMPYLQMNINLPDYSSSILTSDSSQSGESPTSPPSLAGAREGDKTATLGPREAGNYSTQSPRDANATTGKFAKTNEISHENQTKKSNFKNEKLKSNEKLFMQDNMYLLRSVPLSVRRRTLLMTSGGETDPRDVTAALLAATAASDTPPPSLLYQLYTPTPEGEGWQSVAALAVRGGSVQLQDSSRLLASWATEGGRGGSSPRGEGETPIDVALLLVGTVTVLFLLFFVVLLTRVVLGARRAGELMDLGCGLVGAGGGGGGGGGAVLELGQFQFPAEVEGGRRVDTGMESMLSCWLQQLREYGGPDPPPPPHPTHAPHLPVRHTSQPSSTCSVNRLTGDRDRERRTTYKGDPVQMKYLDVDCEADLELKRKTRDLLVVMQSIHHDNLNPFIGCLCSVGRAALVWAHGGRGSLEDVLVADDIRLDWTFRLSLLTDLVRGARHLHASTLRAHGRLTSRNCVVDSRWVLRITDYGLPSFYQCQNLPPPPRCARDLLWSAPELLRAPHAAPSQPGDVFSFAIIMQEVIVRGEPYCMLSLTPEEIVEKLTRPPPLIRPSVSMGAAPPEAVSVMRQCWSEAPDLRPTFDDLYETFRSMHRGRKINIVDSMLEKYSNNLEDLIKERTEQLDMEKRKTEQLLNRMLPKSVAERLLLGSAVEPEEFAEVSIYFSDIVGFTELAARSSPVQVVDLLNDLYTSFDAAIEQHHVYKVETIGDAYMVVGGLPVRCGDHAERVASMALHLLHVAGRFRIRHLPGRPLHLRIGLHSGPCCAGVVGRTMPRYCLFGDTVNTAARMESSGAAWRVQVSAATAQRLSAAAGAPYRLRERGRLRIKGKGVMRTYWLLGKDGFDKPLPTPPPLEKEDALLETETETEMEEEEGGQGEGRQGEVSREETTTGKADEEETSVHVVDRLGWTRCGTMSADSSPPPRDPPAFTSAALAALVTSVPIGDLTAPYSRYRCSSAGGGRVLRRQWSLERGEALAAACVRPPPPTATPLEPDPAAPAAPAAPLALQAPPPRPAPPRYRTRPDAP